MLTPGKYPATLKSADLGQSAAGDAQPTMIFEVADAEGKLHTVYWTGSLKSDKSSELAAKALISAGFQFDDFNKLKEGVNLTTFAPAKVSVELEYGTNKDGTPSDKLRVKWVNKAGELKKYSGSVQKTSAFATAKAAMGMKTAPAKIEEVPF